MCSIVFLKLKMECEKSGKIKINVNDTFHHENGWETHQFAIFRENFRIPNFYLNARRAHTHVLIFEFHINKIVNCLWHSNFRECPIARARSKSLFLSSFCFFLLRILRVFSVVFLCFIVLILKSILCDNLTVQNLNHIQSGEQQDQRGTESTRHSTESILKIQS